jgi:uncharacterized protein (TIGR02996 family)
MQRFELGGAKFWEVSAEGASLTTRWGKIGADAQLKTQQFANAGAAAAARDKLIAEKRAKGYREIKAKTPKPKSRPAARPIAPQASAVDASALVVKELRIGGGRVGKTLIDGKRVITCGEQCLVSSDGKTFHRRKSPGTSFCLYQHGDAIYSTGIGFAVTRDFGQSWQALPAPDEPYYTFTIFRDSQGTWWLGGDDGAIFTAPEIEAGWKKARVEGTGKILDIHEVDGRLLFMGYGSHFLDGTKLEKVKGIDKEHIITRVTETPRGVLIAIGDGGVTYRSTDRGSSWSFVKSGVREDLEDLDWVAGTLFVVGGEGTILKTTDGESWTKVESGTTQHLWGISSWGDGALIGGNYGVVLSLAAPGDTYWQGTTDQLAPPPPTIDAAFEPQRAAAIAERERLYAELYAAASAEHDRISVKAGLSRPKDTNARLAKLVEEAADDDATPAQVYADWLQSEGDPRGELAAIQLRRAHDRKNKELKSLEKELLKQHADRLLGKLQPAHELMKLKWHAGFIRDARIANTTDNDEDDEDKKKGKIQIPDVISWLLDEPSARFLRKLTVGIVTFFENNYEEVAARIGQRFLPSLRELFIGDFDSEDTELSWSELGNVEPIYAALPNLKKLTLRSGNMTLGSIVLPKLEAFIVETGGLDEDAAEAIAAAKWPSLRSLSIQIGAEEYGGDADLEQLRPIFDGVGLPRLEHLGLMNAEITESLIEPLATSKILPQLRSISLGMGTLGDEGVQILYRYQKAFAHLEKIDLDDNFISHEGERLLAQTKLNVHIGEQRDDEGDPSNRYASVAE